MIHKLIIFLVLTLITIGISQNKRLKIFYVYSESGKKYGLKDSNEKVLVVPQYDFIDQSDLSYRRKNIRVKINEKMGLINDTGELILECKYQFVCHFNSGVVGIKQNNLWGYVDTSGFCIIEPKYKTVGEFVNNKTLVRTTDDQLFVIGLNGTLLDTLNEFPISGENKKLELPEPEYEEAVESYFNRVFIDSSTIEYQLSNCKDGEGGYWESYRKLKYDVIYKFEGGWEWNIKRYRIPAISRDEAISMLKNLTQHTDCKMSKHENVIYFNSEKEWITQYEIEEILPQLIEIRIRSSS